MTSNSPLNNKIIRIHKGVDNLIRFRVLNPDRKAVSVDHLSIRCRFINVENLERVLDKTATLTSTKGDVELKIFEGDLVSIAPGFYNLIVTGEEGLVPGVTIGDNFATPFFIDGAGDIVATVEIVASADSTPVPTVEILPDNWRVATEVGVSTPQQRTYYSSAIAGGRVKNHINAVHTFSVATTALSGTLEIRGTLDLQPSGDARDYFPIDITSGTQIITFTNFTGITAHTFEANFLWMIFVFKPTNPVDFALQEVENFPDKVLLR